MGKEAKTNVMRILEQKGIPFRINRYQCDAFIDGVHIADQLGQDRARSFKTLVAAGRSGAHYVFALPVAKELDLRKAAAAVGEKSVELVPVKELTALTGYIRGGCTPIGMKKQFQTVFDETALLFDEIIISGGRIGTQIILNPLELKKVIPCQFKDILL